MTDYSTEYGQPFNKARRVLNKAEYASHIPQDYLERWDASTSNGMTFSSGTELSAWLGANGTYTITTTGVVTTNPIWTRDADGKPAVYFAQDGVIRGVGAIGPADGTIIAVVRADIDVAGGYRYILDTPWLQRVTTKGNTDADSLNLRVNSVDDYTTNSFDDRRAIVGFTNTHVGTNDNDHALYVGKTNTGNQTTVSDANSTGTGLALGGLYSTASEEFCHIYEILMWNRVLSTTEYDAVVDYLSAKWDTTNADNASDTVTAKTQETWTTRFIDKTGTAASGTPIGHTIKPLGEEGAPTVSGTTHYDDAYPAHFAPAALTVTQAFWFRADVTEGMTFDTGDKHAGGTVSSWTDLWGNVTMDTTASGDAAVDFTPNGRGARPAITGGTSASPKSLEANVTITSVNSMTRLAWSVVGHVGGDSSQGTGLIGNNWYAARDLNDDVGHMGMTGGTGTAKTSGPPGSGLGGISINIWTMDTSDSNAGRMYTAGFEHPRDPSVTLVNNFRCAVGALSTSNFDSEAYVYEIGMLGFGVGGNLPTDDEIHTFIKHLCNRYDVDYMPSNTPWLISATANYTANYVVFQMPYHYRADEGLTLSSGTITDWELKEPTASIHSRVLNDTDGQNAPDHGLNMLDRDGATFVSASSESLADATTYTWSETGVFIGPQGGATGGSVFLVGRNNAKTSSGYMWDGATSIRQSTTTGKIQFRANANNLDGLSDENGNWVIAIGTYDHTSGDQNLYVNADAVQNTTDGAPAAFSSTTPNVGADNAGASDNDCDILEVAEFKHVLSAEEVENLQRYARYRYNDSVDFDF